MKVFISWSGTRSKALAIALKEWIPCVLQYVEPWVSEKDISAGDRWAQAIASELETSNFGIICITPENLSSEWILFEAGALSKSMQDAKVIPLLFGLELSDLGGPLSQFQALKVDENGLREVIRSINDVAENKASEGIINRLIPNLWPDLNTNLEKILDEKPSEKHARPQHEILEELVTSVRGLNTRMRDFEPDFDDLRPTMRRHKHRKMRLHILDEFTFSLSDKEDASIALVVMAGLIRDDLPWLAEVILESYRELKVASGEEAERIASRLHRFVKHCMHGPLAEILINSKETHMLFRELPHFTERALDQLMSSK